MSDAVQNIIDALSFGSLYALMALGIALIFGVMRLINFAHGELVMVGAYAAVLIVGSAWPLIVLISIAVSVLFALGMDRAAFRPIRGASAPTLLIMSFALSYLLQSLAILILGAEPRSGIILPQLNGVIVIANVTIPWISVATVATTLVTLLALTLFLNYTPIGLEMRAAAEDFRMAQLLGVKSDAVIAAAFALSGGLAAIAALLLVAQIGVVTTTIGSGPLLVAFIATILGGLGSLLGAVVGAYLVGALTVALQTYLPLELRNYRDAFVYAGIIAVLLIRPQGLFRPRATTSRI